jgi:hypothetical protein
MLWVAQASTSRWGATTSRKTMSTGYWLPSASATMVARNLPPARTSIESVSRGAAQCPRDQHERRDHRGGDRGHGRDPDDPPASPSRSRTRRSC